ncbi:MAG TPA: phage tail protein [Vicinamibacterales bacterium]|nr:phage tail protein [Vicinamibacterales bacterium]
MTRISKTSLIPAVLVLLLTGSAVMRGQEREYYFAATANDGQFDLGSWSKATGLDVTFDIAEYRSRDEANSFQRYLRESFEHGTVTLHRAGSSESAVVKEWADLLARSYERPTTAIMMLDQSGQPVARWTLTGVFPTKVELSAPDGSQSEDAIETLVLAYESLVVERCPCSR